VLVGEDEVLIRRGIAEELEAAGYTAFEPQMRMQPS
jgi:hypothetical protein